MPDYLLTSPEGERFKLVVPEGTPEEEVHSTLAGILPSESAQEAREAAAGRVKQAAAPGQRKEGPVTDYLVGMGETAKRQMEGVASDLARHPENLVGTGELGPALGIVRPTMRQIARSGPGAIRSHLDELQEAVRRGQMTPEQLEQARVRMGLPARAPDYLTPISARQPGTGVTQFREPSQQTIAEMRQITEDLEHEPPFPFRRTAPPPEPPRQGFLGGENPARQVFRNYIAPHIDEQQFAHKYFDGMYSQNIRMRSSGYTDGRGLEFNGPLTKNGQVVGEIMRRIKPNAGVAYHDFFELEDGVQGAGIAKSLMRNQIDIYRQIGISRVETNPGLEVGGYAWAKYGFVPTEASWISLQRNLRQRLRYLQIDRDLRSMAEILIESENPLAIWLLSDLKQPVGRNIAQDQVPLGKALLLGQNWKGSLSLNDSQMMQRFDAYVQPR